MSSKQSTVNSHQFSVVCGQVMTGLEVRKEVFRYAKKIESLIMKHALDGGKGAEYRHIRANDLLLLVLAKSMGNRPFGELFIQWCIKGGTSMLRDQILSQLDYNNDFIPDFNAFVLIDDLGIELRKEASHG